MKIKLNEAIKSFDMFINEREVAAEVETVAVESPEVDSRSAMIADVDTIITSLETLAGSVAEMVEEMNNFDNEVSEELEAVNEGPVQWVKGKMLQGKQKKITTMKLKSSDMASAAAGLQGAENRDKKSYIIDKKKQLDDSIKQIQSMVDDKAKDIGGPALRIVNKEKIKGQMAVIKSQIGNVDPKKAKGMKDRLADLQGKYKEEGEAIQQLKDKADSGAEDVKGDDDTNALKDEIKKLQGEKKTIDKSTTKGELEDVMMDIKIYGLKMKVAVEDGDAKTDPSEFDDKILKLKTKAAELKTKLDGYSEAFELDGSGRITLSNNLTIEKIEENEITEETSEETAKDITSTVSKLSLRANAVGLNELASEIDSKLDWQIAEGTGLRLKYESAIKKAESDKILSESRYFDNNVKDAFRRLL